MEGEHTRSRGWLAFVGADFPSDSTADHDLRGTATATDQSHRLRAANPLKLQELIALKLCLTLGLAWIKLRLD